MSAEQADLLNSRFSHEAYLWNPRQLALLRKLPRPIVIDFANTLVSTNKPWTPNSEAVEPLKELTTIGTVLVVSEEFENWDTQRQALEEFGMWHPGMILINGHNLHPNPLFRDYYFTSANQHRVGAVEAYQGRLQETLTPDMEHALARDKSLAPALRKIGRAIDVPIIDNDAHNTDGIPGMLGLLVKSFAPDIPDFQGEAAGSLSLFKAAQQVRIHYNSPFRDSLVSAGFDEGTLRWEQRLLMLKHDSNTIVRASMPIDGLIGKLTPERHTLLNQVLKEFENRYGFSVPRHDVVIGPAGTEGERIHYIITDRIHEEKQEGSEFYKKMSRHLTSLIRYIWDRSNEGGIFMNDVTTHYPMQFVYGKRVDDTEPHLWFTDLLQHMDRVEPGDYYLFIRQIRYLHGDMGYLPNETVEEAIKLLRLIPSKHEAYKSVANTIDLLQR